MQRAKNSATRLVARAALGLEVDLNLVQPVRGVDVFRHRFQGPGQVRHVVHVAVHVHVAAAGHLQGECRRMTDC